MSDRAAKPHSKETQVGAGRPKRYRRRVASPKQWAALRAEKLDGRFCRLNCFEAADQLHHLVPRSQGGDDTADGLVPLCAKHHERVTRRDPEALRFLAESLTDAEYAYCVGKLGEGAMTRLFGVLPEPRP